MKKTWTWSATGFNLESLTIAEIASVCRHAGVSGIEGAPPLAEALGLGRTDEVGRQLLREGVRMHTFHLPFSSDDDIASFYETRRKRAVDNMQRWMERAANFGARICIQHPTTSHYETEVEGLDHFFRQMSRSLYELLPVAERLHLVIAVENMLPGQGSRFFSHADHMRRFLEEFDHPHLGLCLDTGHALVAGGAEGADGIFEAMQPGVVAFHLADNGGNRDSHLPPGHGNVDWSKVFRRMADMQFAGAACIEAPPFDFGPPYSLEAWKMMVDRAEALAQTALAEL